MELYEQIRREHEFGAGSIIGVARKLGLHRRTVREAVRSALPARRKKTERSHLRIGRQQHSSTRFWKLIVRHRKQRHTAKRI